MPSYLSHVHLPTVPVPTLWYWGFAGAAAAAAPGAAAPPFMIASICFRRSGGRFFSISMAPAIRAAAASRSAFDISMYDLFASLIIIMTCRVPSKMMTAFCPVGPVLSVRMRC